MKILKDGVTVVEGLAELGSSLNERQQSMDLKIYVKLGEFVIVLSEDECWKLYTHADNALIDWEEQRQGV